MADLHGVIMSILFKIYIKAISRVATVAYTGSLKRNKAIEERFYQSTVNTYLLNRAVTSITSKGREQ